LDRNLEFDNYIDVNTNYVVRNYSFKYYNVNKGEALSTKVKIWNYNNVTVDSIVSFKNLLWIELHTKVYGGYEGSEECEEIKSI
jgi:hypothetical protein